MTDKNTADKHAIDNNVAQGIAAYIDYLNQLRVSTLMDTLRQILNNETGQLKDLAERQANALRNLDLANQNVMNIVNSGRGGENGMHGFIAEFAQTGIANARRAFEGLEKSTITLNDNGPADLLINGKPVQVKFYANLMNELKTSAEYRSMDMMFSKDHMDIFRAVMHGDKEVFLNGQPLTSNQVQKIKQLIEEESNIRGLSWDKWMRRRFRMYIWKQWKKPKTKVANLRKLGVPADKAYQWGNSRLGYWLIAGSHVLECSITNERLAAAGYVSILNYYESLHLCG